MTAKKPPEFKPIPRPKDVPYGAISRPKGELKPIPRPKGVPYGAISRSTATGATPAAKPVAKAAVKPVATAVAKKAAGTVGARALGGAAARVGSRLLGGPAGAALGVGELLYQGVKSQANQNVGTVNTRHGKKTRTASGPASPGRGGKRR